MPVYETFPMFTPGVLAVLLTAASALVLLVAWRRPEAVVAHRVAVLAIVAVVSIAAAGTLIDPRSLTLRVRLDPSEEPLLPRGDPARLVYEDAVRNFGDDDLFVVGMTTNDVFTAGSLGALRRISDRLRRLPGVRGVESLVTTTAYGWDRAAGLLRVEPFIEEIPDDPAALAALRARALADRLYRRTLVSRDGRTAALNVSFRPMSDREFVDAGLDDAIAAVLIEETTPERRFFVTGRQHVKAQAARFMVRDLVRLIPLAVLVGAAVAGIATGSLRAAVLPVAASLVATLWTMAILVIVGRPLNLITLVLAPMLICIGSVYGVHVLARFEALRASISDRRAAAVACVRDTRLPVLISGATTMIGFGALLISATPAVREFGGFSLVGVGLMTGLALTAFPALLAVVPAPAPRSRGRGRVERVLDAFLTVVARLTARRSGVILVLWTLVTGLALAAVPRIVVDTDYLSFFDPRSSVRRDFATVERAHGRPDADLRRGDRQR